MIMTGMQSIHITRSGKKFLKVFSVILALSFVLSACSYEDLLGAGRGDFTLDLCGGYGIAKINSKSIIFIKRNEKNPDILSDALEENFFVLGYQMEKPYIFLQGILPRNGLITDAELEARQLSYYVVNSATDEIAGPFRSYDSFAEHCASLSINISDEWIKPEG